MNGGGIGNAKVVLEEAAKLCPAEPMAQYNRACYCSQLGQLDDTRLIWASGTLGDAMQIKLMALEENLKPHWEDG